MPDRLSDLPARALRVLTGLPRPGRRARVAALAWLGAVLLSGTVAWNAVAVIADDSARTGVLSQDQVAATLAMARADAATTAPNDQGTGSATTSPDPTLTPTGTPTAEPTSAQPTAEPGTVGPSVAPSGTPGTVAPAAETATWQVTGGTVTVQCVGATIGLVAATPADGWTVSTGSTGPQKVEVELHRSEHETHLVATCQGGVPVSQVGDGEDPDGHEDSHQD